MGSPEGEAGRFRDEGPRHEVTISRAFALGKYEVTRAEFGIFARETELNWPAPSFSQTDRDPAVNVTWGAATQYVAWLSERTGQTYRLPSEAEWEYAARAGTAAARYWGERPDAACVYANVGDESHGCSDGYTNTAPVGEFRANDFGLYDMLGNVWEWVEDCYAASYSEAPTDGSAWTTGDCTRRVLRGGCWDDYPMQVRSAARARFPYNRGRVTANIFESSDSGICSGFRVAKTLQ